MSSSDGNVAADVRAADFIPICAGDARKGGFLVIKGKPCKIVDGSKVGEYGAAECHFIGVDIFTAKEYEHICPASDQLAEPIVSRTEYQLVDITDDGFLSLMAKDNSMRDDIKLPDDEALAKNIQEAFDTGDDVVLTVLGALGIEQVRLVPKGTRRSLLFPQN